MLASGRILQHLHKMRVILYELAEISFSPEPGANIDVRRSGHFDFLTHVFVTYADFISFCNTSRARSGIRVWAAQISLLARPLQCPHSKIHIFAKKSARNPLPRWNGTGQAHGPTHAAELPGVSGGAAARKTRPGDPTSPAFSFDSPCRKIQIDFVEKRMKSV